MTSPWRDENECLRWSWDRHNDDHLDRYLVSDVEDPRMHPQSVLTRSLVVDTLWPEVFEGLIHEELRFSAIMTWLLLELRAGAERMDLLDRIDTNRNECPAFVSEAYDWLATEDCPVFDYLSGTLMHPPTPETEQALPDSALGVFEAIWQAELEDQEADKLKLLELACGSANDYRFLHSFGLARFLDYRGIDISPRNIANAKRRFPEVDFEVGSVFEIPSQDAAFDYVFLHDLFEHLSPEGLEQALSEVMRVTGKQAWLHFFNLADMPQHEVQQVERYHWNKLSLPLVLEALAPQAQDIEVWPIPTLLKEKFGYEGYYNQEAVTLIVTV